MLQLRPTFSESWYRVVNLRPKLRGRRRSRGSIIAAIAGMSCAIRRGNQFHRLSDRGVSLRRPARRHAHGRRSVGPGRRAARRRRADAAGSHPDPLAALRGQPGRNRHPAGCDGAAPPAQELQKRQMQGRLMNVLFPRIPIWDPDRFLKRWLPLVRPFLSKLGRDRLAGGGDRRRSRRSRRTGTALNKPQSTASNIAAESDQLRSTSVVFVLIKFIHECGHAFTLPALRRRSARDGHHVPGVHPDAVRRRAHRVGFPEQWQRMFVGAGGMIVELFVAAICCVRLGEHDARRALPSSWRTTRC